MNVLITGSGGFIGKNLCSHLKQKQNINLITFVRKDSHDSLRDKVMNSDIIIHLAGENRPKDQSQFKKVNVQLTRDICEAIKRTNKKIPIFFSSSIHAESYSSYPKNSNNYNYGKSKRDAEIILEEFSENYDNTAIIYRAPGIFGKWSQPNYNSVVSTLCHNIANDQPVFIENPETELSLVHIDDFVNQILNDFKNIKKGCSYQTITNVYSITLGRLYKVLTEFKESRSSLLLNDIGTGIDRLLYTTYIIYLKPANFIYKVPKYEDDRGVFVEMIKTKNSGQFSYFTSKPGITRGEHFHHIKSEKFMILSGVAKFSFRNTVTNEKYDITLEGNDSQIIETAPGWTHKITNIGKEELIAIVWANENFNKEKPDTILQKV
jgi:UDP-2-acetamido-2,6-beta-L-arabino-hexul-4-ose reductase